MTYHRCYFFLVFLCFCRVCAGQGTVKAYVQANTVEVKHINLSDSNFSDLEPLGEAIGNSRIVALGEQMHGDGTTFQAKGRLIKYLHEKKGFNLLVFESDFFGLTYGFEKVRGKGNIELGNFLFNNLLGLWSWCKNAAPFIYQYIAQTQQTPNPFLLAGMDCQHQSAYTFENLQVRLGKILEKLVVNPQDTLQVNQVLNNVPATFFKGQKADAEGCEKGLNALMGLMQLQQLKKLQAEETIILQNVLAAFRNILPFLQQKAATPDKHLYRDRQMFDNIMWLLNYKYPNEKVIIWAHNAHIMKAKDKVQENYLMAGNYLGDSSINPFTYYAIGFTSYSATSVFTASYENPFYAQKPERHSFESWINRKWRFAFTDWSRYRDTSNRQKAFFMKGSFEATQHINYRYSWNKVFDGVFFIRNIEGCSTLDYESLPEYYRQQ